MHQLNNYILLFLVTILAALGTSKPIMVSFGTNDGPIVPRQTTTTLPPRIDANPAPVFEKPEDVPNPSIYKPLVPHQYRSKIFSYKPHPNLILGTPLDIKYTPSLNKYAQKKRQIKSLGTGYRGPQVFEKQDYEYDLEKQRSPLVEARVAESRSYSEDSSEYQSTNQQSNLVPQIGIIYSSGVRYYVPQIYDHSSEENNSVYDGNDRKYYHQNKSYY
ncbi:hypothetical protein Trydic_g14768 [Trypoxylus dichotomus]